MENRTLEQSKTTHDWSRSLQCSGSRPQFSQQSSQGSSHILLQPLLHSGHTPTCLSIGGKHPRHHLVLRRVRVVVAGRLSAGALLPWWLPHVSPIHACARPVTACEYTVIKNSEPLRSTFSCHTNSRVVEGPTSHTSRVTRSKVAPRLHVLADKGAHCHRRAGSRVSPPQLCSFWLQFHHLCAHLLQTSLNSST